MAPKVSQAIDSGLVTVCGPGVRSSSTSTTAHDEQVPVPPPTSPATEGGEAAQLPALNQCDATSKCKCYDPMYPQKVHGLLLEKTTLSLLGWLAFMLKLCVQIALLCSTVLFLALVERHHNLGEGAFLECPIVTGIIATLISLFLLVAVLVPCYPLVCLMLRWRVRNAHVHLPRRGCYWFNVLAFRTSMRWGTMPTIAMLQDWSSRPSFTDKWCPDPVPNLYVSCKNCIVDKMVGARVRGRPYPDVVVQFILQYAARVQHSRFDNPIRAAMMYEFQRTVTPHIRDVAGHLYAYDWSKRTIARVLELKMAYGLTKTWRSNVKSCLDAIAARDA